MTTRKPRFQQSRALRFYHEVLGLDRLHYGLWEDDDPRDLEGVRQAQERYEQFLIDRILKITPTDGKARVLDAGCGSGIMCARLYAFPPGRYQVEGLSPDLYQRDVFMQRVPVPFHLARFQDFEPSEPYDIILMSESCQYVPLDQLFPAAVRSLRPGGRLLICDYFTYDDATGPLSASGHRLSAIRRAAETAGFVVRSEIDLTQQVLPTLDIAREFIERFILPSAMLLTEGVAQRRPLLFRLGRFLLRREMDKAKLNMSLLDSEEFSRNKRYLYLDLARDPA